MTVNVLTKRRIAERMGSETGYTSMTARRDWKAVSELYTEDAFLIESGTITAVGRRQIAELLKKEYTSPDYMSPRVQTLEDKIVIAKDGQSALVPEVFTYGKLDDGHGMVWMQVVLVDGEILIRSEMIEITA